MIYFYEIVYSGLYILSGIVNRIRETINNKKYLF